MEIDEIKDLLNNSAWKADTFAGGFRFVSDTIHNATGPLAKYEVIEKDGKRFIEFDKNRLQIIDANEFELMLNDGKTDFKLLRVIL